VESTSLLNSERAEEYLQNHNLAALISSSRINTTYLTDFDCLFHVHDRLFNVVPGSGDDYVQLYGIYAKGGEKCLVIPQSMYFTAELEGNQTMTKYTYGKPLSFRADILRFDTDLERSYEARITSGKDNFDSAQDALCAAVKALIGGYNSDSVAIDQSEMSTATKTRLESNFPKLEFKKANETFRFLRMVKSKEELRRLEVSSRIVERSLLAIIDAIKPGVSEVDIRRTFVQNAISQGGSFETVHFMCPHGTKAGAMTTPTRDTYKKDSSGWLDFGCLYEGYYSDIGESFAIGRVDEKVPRLYDTLKNVIEHCQEIIHPGMKCSELNAEASKMWEESGIPKPPTGMGHGIGLDVHEYPRISAAKGDAIHSKSAIKDDIIESSIDIPFEEGMVLAIEAPYMQWGWGGVHLERNVVVEKSGSRTLSDEPRFLRRIEAS
jgi:Xaa-Pro aminopeptidase